MPFSIATCSMTRGSTFVQRSQGASIALKQLCGRSLSPSLRFCLIHWRNPRFLGQSQMAFELLSSSDPHQLSPIDILSDIYSDTISGSLFGILSDIYSHILPDILLSGLCSGPCVQRGIRSWRFNSGPCFRHCPQTQTLDWQLGRQEICPSYHIRILNTYHWPMGSQIRVWRSTTTMSPEFDRSILFSENGPASRDAISVKTNTPSCGTECSPKWVEQGKNRELVFSPFMMIILFLPFYLCHQIPLPNITHNNAKPVSITCLFLLSEVGSERHPSQSPVLSQGYRFSLPQTHQLWTSVVVGKL